VDALEIPPKYNIANFCPVEYRMPPVGETRMTVPRLFDALEKAETKAQALDACLKMLSEHGLLSDIAKRPGLFEKLEKWRGKK